MPLQQFHPTGECEVGRDRLEIRENVAGADIQLLQEENLARKRQLHASHFPLTATHVRLAHQKMATSIQMTEYAPAESDFLFQCAVNLGDPILFSIDQH